jgi:hypothetical protein
LHYFDRVSLLIHYQLNVDEHKQARDDKAVYSIDNAAVRKYFTELFGFQRVLECCEEDSAERSNDCYEEGDREKMHLELRGFKLVVAKNAELPVVQLLLEQGTRGVDAHGVIVEGRH